MLGATERTSPDNASRVGHPLVGMWELQAIKRDGLPLEGSVPRACILFTPGGRFFALLSSDTEPQLAAAFREAFAYAGLYRVVGEAWITTLKRSWSDVAVSGEHMHFYRIEGRSLHVRPERSEFVFRKLQ